MGGADDPQLWVVRMNHPVLPYGSAGVSGITVIFLIPDQADKEISQEKGF